MALFVISFFFFFLCSQSNILLYFISALAKHNWGNLQSNTYPVFYFSI